MNVSDFVRAVGVVNGLRNHFSGSKPLPRIDRA